MHKAEDIKLANATARASGAIGPKAVLPVFCFHASRPKDRILDFGAGPTAAHASLLRSMGRKVDAYDFGKNFNMSLHINPKPGSYDLVYASNVLNVQASEEMLNLTLRECWSFVIKGGKFICNYPVSPRKLALTKRELGEKLKEYYEEVDLSYPKNIIVCRKPRAEPLLL